MKNRTANSFAKHNRKDANDRTMRANLLTLMSLLGFHSAVASQCTNWETPKLQRYQDDTPVNSERAFLLTISYLITYNNYKKEFNQLNVRLH